MQAHIVALHFFTEAKLTFPPFLALINGKLS